LAWNSTILQLSGKTALATLSLLKRTIHTARSRALAGSKIMVLDITSAAWRVSTY
jgi:hypothetical protein